MRNEVRVDDMTMVVIRFKDLELLCAVDAADLDLLSPYRWCARQARAAYYAQANRTVDGRRTSLQMHRLIMGVVDQPEVFVDHINRNTLDNRRANLRLLTPAESAQNKGKYANSTSRYRGVSWFAPNQKWVAKGGKGGKVFHLGYFENEEEAGNAAAAWRSQHLPYAER